MVMRPYGFAVMLAVGLAVTAYAVADVHHLPIRDPDGAIGPAYIWVPTVILAAIALDVLPRAVRGAWSAGGLRTSLVAVWKERWPAKQLQLVLVGLGSWYVTYAAFRNLKSFLPFVRDGVDDASVASVDRVLTFGRDPADVLHNLLGTGIAAHVLSFAYVAWIVFVPMTLAIAMVWSRNTALGVWWVTTIGIDWVLGVATYYALPTLGPIYWTPGQFADLPDTWVTGMQDSMMADRFEVIANPYATTAVQTIAAFASLHVAILMSACVLAHLARLPAVVRWSLWAFLAITTVSTVYLGWHYLVDAVGGAVMGTVAALIGAVVTQNGRLVPLRRTHETEPVAVPARA